MLIRNLALALAMTAPLALGQNATYTSIPYSGTGTVNVVYSPSVTYPPGRFVLENGVTYMSLAPGNLGNDPATTPSQWLRLSPIVTGIASDGSLSVSGPISQGATITNTGTGGVSADSRTLVFDGTTNTGACPWNGGNCSTARYQMFTANFGVEGQNVPEGYAVNFGSPGDGKFDHYCYGHAGDDMTNAESVCGHTYFDDEFPGLDTFAVSDSGTGLTSIHQPNIQVGIGRFIANITPDWTGTVVSGQWANAEPFAQAQLPGRTDAAGVYAQFGAATTPGSNVVIPINTTSGYAHASHAGTAFHVGPACFAEGGATHRYFEIQQITAVSGSTITVASMHHGHSGNAIVAQDGLCGYGLEMTANTTASGVDAIQLWPIMTSIDGSGTVEYAQGLDGAMVATEGTTGYTAANNGAKLYKIAVTYGFDNASHTYTLSPNSIAWSAGPTYFASHGLDQLIGGWEFYADQVTPGRDNNIRMLLSSSGYLASHPTDRVLDMSMGGSMIQGSYPLALGWIHGGSSFAWKYDSGTNGSYVDDADLRNANSTSTFTTWSFDSGGAIQHTAGGGSAGWAITGDYLNLPPATNVVWSGLGKGGPCWSYTVGTAPYICLHNVPVGGYGNGDVWLSFDDGNDAPHYGDAKGNVQLNLIKLPALKAASGTRFLCIDTNGVITSQTTACSGT